MPHNQSLSALFYDVVHRSGAKLKFPYPQNTKAFLYYLTPPKKPRIAGEVRLRVASSYGPASFKSGFDLLKSNGQPWSRSLYAVSRHYIPLYKKLREEQLVPDDLDAVLSTLPLDKMSKYRGIQKIYTINDTFMIDFSFEGQNFTVITEQGIEKIRLLGLFIDWRKSVGCTPYTGSALARFERSTLPEHQGTRTIVLRFLKITAPVKCVVPLYDGQIVPPQEGELHQRSPSRTVNKVQPRVWSFNIDNLKAKGVNVKARGLQMLWDT